RGARGGARRRRRRRGRSGPRPVGAARLRDLHLRVDRTSPGGGGAAPRGGAALHLDGSVVRLLGGGRVDAVPFGGVRFLGLGAVGSAAPRRAPGGGAVLGEPLARVVPPAAARTGGDGAQPDALGVGAAAGADGGGRGGAAGAALGGLRRR